MCRPLKNIVAELEAKYKGYELLYDLEERRRVIANFDSDVAYMFRCFEKFEEDVKFVLEHKIDTQILKRAALNFVFIMQQLCESILEYRHDIDFYLVDDCYEKNQSLYRRFTEIHEKMKSLFDRLIDNDVFREEKTDLSGVRERFTIHEDADDEEIAIVVTTIKINKDETERMSTAELLICLDYQFDIFQNN